MFKLYSLELARTLGCGSAVAISEQRSANNATQEGHMDAPTHVEVPFSHLLSSFGYACHYKRVHQRDRIATLVATVALF